MAERKVIDREKLELDYRAGLRTFKEMAQTHGISGPRIKQIANKEGWERDLGVKIRQTAAAKLAKSIPTPEKLETERQIVDQGSDSIVTIVLAHRKDAGRARTLAMTMLGELESMTRAPDMFEDLQDCLSKCRAGEDIPPSVLAKADELLGQALTLGSRSGVLKSLADSLTKVVAIEREAFGINDPDPPPVAGDAGAAAHAQALQEKFLSVIAKHSGAQP